ncbi:MAG: pyridoxal phosphate-dependent aminotransferase family protein [Candidatus Fermentibacteraceae bacterium]|nr:pyridoxal phosphate-dependent aminotransferase family protein [Candidatus Fermentibacteraceae bacterium]MBN2607988.1 pyridoxal phosphate-dependent aminotransferase family protein [Candidatus Fermentibacteraceae bacterium]
MNLTENDVFQKCFDYERLEQVKKSGLYPYFIPLSGHVGAEMKIEGHSIIMLGSNNYLGLTDHPRVMESAKDAIDKYGTGCTGSRFLNGTLDLHIELERRLAEFLDKEMAITFSTGFQSNMGVISTIAGRNDIIYLDRLDHASIIDGSRMSYGRVLKYRHNDHEHLRYMLENNRKHPGVIVTDGVFSMEGDLADIPGLVEISKEFGVRLIVDDAHGVGAMGPRGRGTAEHFGCHEDVDILVGTFSKSFACVGGFAAGPARVMEYIKHTARTMIFSASLPPAAVATVIAALDVLEQEPELVSRSHSAAERARQGLASMGYNVGNSEAPIVPIIVGDEVQTLLFWKSLYQEGVFTNPVVSPAVASGGEMLRTSYMATHTDAMIDRALETFEKCGKALGII